jgi:hypothetical protein
VHLANDFNKKISKIIILFPAFGKEKELPNVKREQPKSCSLKKEPKGENILPINSIGNYLE